MLVGHVWASMLEQNRRCVCDVTLRCVCVTIIAVVKWLVLDILIGCF